MSIDPSSERFEIGITVAPEDIDAQKHVSNIVYVRWIQEALESPGVPWRLPVLETIWRWFSDPSLAG